MTRLTLTFFLASAFASWTAPPLVADELPNGILSGTVVYEGKPYPKPSASSLPIGEVESGTLLVNPNDGGIANVVLSLTPSTNTRNAVYSPKNVVVRVTDTGFSPRVIVLRAGDKLQLSNMGEAAHNINIRSIRNAPMNVILSPGKQMTFAPSRPERWPVALGCSIKPWMAAWIIVSNSPHVAVSDEHGRFRFRDVAAGEYDVEIWHERTGAVRDVELGNRMLIPTAKGYKLRLETVPADLGRIAFAARQFDTE